MVARVHPRLRAAQAAKLAFFSISIVAWAVASVLRRACGLPLGAQLRLNQLAARLGLLSLGVKMSRPSHYTLPPPGSVLMSNHISYVDVLVYASLFPTAFVTSKEVMAGGFLARICRLGATLSMDRSSATAMRGELACLRSVIERGHRLMIFPEATSSAGASVLPFKRAAFWITEQMSAPLTVYSIQYPQAVRRQVAYIDDDVFGPHLLGLLSAPAVVAQITHVGVYERGKVASTREFTDEVYAKVLAAAAPKTLGAPLGPAKS